MRDRQRLLNASREQALQSRVNLMRAAVWQVLRLQYRQATLIKLTILWSGKMPQICLPEKLRLSRHEKPVSEKIKMSNQNTIPVRGVKSAMEEESLKNALVGYNQVCFRAVRRGLGG